MFDVPGIHVIDVQIDNEQRLVLTVESDQLEHGCPGCGVLAVGHGRRCRTLHDAPCLGRVTVLRWLTRVWRCLERECATTTFTEQHPIAPPRAVLTVRAVGWATDALSHDDTTVSALLVISASPGRAWVAIEAEAKARVGKPERLGR
jgi:transposase